MKIEPPFNQLIMFWRSDQPLKERRLTPGYRLRTYREGDTLEYIRVCADGLNKENWTERDFQREMVEQDGFIPEALFLAEKDDGEIVGTASGRTPWPTISDDIAYLHMVSVIPEHRGKGLGQALTASVQRFMLDKGKSGVVLQTDDFRLPAFKSYLSLGFRPIVPDRQHQFRWQLVLRALGCDDSVETYTLSGTEAEPLRANPLLPLPITDKVYLVEPPYASYLIIDREEAMLIDTGPADKGQRVKDSLDAMGILQSIKSIVCTHCHLDHSGAAGFIEKATGAKILAHQNDIACMEDTDVFFEKHPWGDRYRLWAGSSYKVNRALLGEEVLRVGATKLRVIHTPGHTSGTISLFMPKEQILFTGDLLQYSRPYRKNRWLGIVEDAVALQRSWKRLSNLNFQLLLPSHDGFDTQYHPINAGDNAREDLQSCMEMYETILAEVKKGHREYYRRNRR